MSPLHSHYFFPAFVLGMVGVDEAAKAGATPLHFAAVGLTILGIAAVLRGYDWAEHKVKAVVSDALAIHAAEDRVWVSDLTRKVSDLAGKVEKWSTRPCIAGCKCGKHGDAG